VTSVCGRTGSRGEGVALAPAFYRSRGAEQRPKLQQDAPGFRVWSREIGSDLTWFSYVFNIFPSCSR